MPTHSMCQRKWNIIAFCERKTESSEHKLKTKKKQCPADNPQPKCILSSNTTFAKINKSRCVAGRRTVMSPTEPQAKSFGREWSLFRMKLKRFDDIFFAAAHRWSVVQRKNANRSFRATTTLRNPQWQQFSLIASADEWANVLNVWIVLFCFFFFYFFLLFHFRWDHRRFGKAIDIKLEATEANFKLSTRFHVPNTLLELLND